MELHQVQEAVQRAEADLRKVDRVAEALARLLVGRLRKVGSGWVLGQLKKELAKFNRHTGTWSD